MSRLKVSSLRRALTLRRRSPACQSQHVLSCSDIVSGFISDVPTIPFYFVYVVQTVGSTARWTTVSSDDDVFVPRAQFCWALHPSANKWECVFVLYPLYVSPGNHTYTVFLSLSAEMTCLLYTLLKAAHGIHE